MGISCCPCTTTLSVTTAADQANLAIDDISTMYALPDFAAKLEEYLFRCTNYSRSHLTSEWSNNFVVWHKFRIQRYSISRPSVIMPSELIQAYPPSPSAPLGNCDVVLLNSDGQSQHNPGYHVVQVRAIFQLAHSPHIQSATMAFLTQPLVYIQPFDIVATPEDQLDTRLWILERIYTSSTPACRAGLIIPLTEVAHSADLVPVFGERVDYTVTRRTSQETYNRFYLNYYTSKEAFDLLYYPSQP